MWNFLAINFFDIIDWIQTLIYWIEILEWQKFSKFFFNLSSILTKVWLIVPNNFIFLWELFWVPPHHVESYGCFQVFFSLAKNHQKGHWPKFLKIYIYIYISKNRNQISSILKLGETIATSLHRSYIFHSLLQNDYQLSWNLFGEIHHY